MPTQFKWDCPHCLTSGAGFTVAFQWPDRKASNRAFFVAICGVCNNGLVVHSYCTNSTNHLNLPGYDIEFPSAAFRVLNSWPERSLTIPSDLPANVESFFTQGLENLRAARWDAAGAMFRKTLDVATKLIAPQYKEKSLYHRIESLVGDGLLTNAIGEWSHEIRIDGNDAVHDEEPETEADALALQKFCEAFLTYSFSLPSMVAQNRQKRDLTEPDKVIS